jgi:hypothetical protein
MGEETRIRLDKQLEKAPEGRMIPMSLPDGELHFTDLVTAVKSGETLTHLDSVAIVSGNLVIKYTAENNKQQVVSTPMNFAQVDVKLTDALLDHPSAGVYRLIIKETDGSSFPVDLSALLASVTRNTQYTSLSGNGTPENPLQVDLTDTFWQKVPKTLGELTDVSITQDMLDQAAAGTEVALAFDGDKRQWVARNVMPTQINNYMYMGPGMEITETFSDLNTGNTVTLKVPIGQINTASVKVFRNGLRQCYGLDYDLANLGNDPCRVMFPTPFAYGSPETVIVDYRPAA